MTKLRYKTNMIKNKLTATTTILCICLFSINAMAYELPAECKKILDSKFSGWKLAKPSDEVAAYYAKEKITNAPNLTMGDWNGDGKQDYAVLIEYGGKKAENKLIKDIWIIAFIKTANGYNQYKLEGGDYIQTVKKGKKDFNAETQKTFTHKTDAIFSAIWEKSGTAYIWSKTKFKTVITSD
jgi:hypothetical protein